MAKEHAPGRVTGMSVRKYSTWRRPFRLQLSVASATDFTAPASRGQCRRCRERFEWQEGALYCRDCWLVVHQATTLPERRGTAEK